MKSKKNQQKLFIMTVIISAVLIFIFNMLTPMMSDDLFYAKEAQSAGSFVGLVQQEYHQYMTWSGRSVSHLILRCFLLGDKIIFNFFNSFVFVGLTLLIYLNIERRKKE